MIIVLLRTLGSANLKLGYQRRRKYQTVTNRMEQQYHGHLANTVTQRTATANGLAATENEQKFTEAPIWDFDEAQNNI